MNRQIQTVVMALLQMKILFLFVSMAVMVPIRKSFCTKEDRSRGGGGIMDESGKEESY